MAAAAANNVRVFFMPLLDIVGRMAWPRLDGMAELCRWQVWPYSIQRAGQNADDIKNVAVRRLRLAKPGRYVITNMEMCGRVAKRKFGKLIFLLWAPRGPAPKVLSSRGGDYGCNNR